MTITKKIKILDRDKIVDILREKLVHLGYHETENQQRECQIIFEREEIRSDVCCSYQCLIFKDYSVWFETDGMEMLIWYSDIDYILEKKDRAIIKIGESSISII